MEKQDHQHNVWKEIIEMQKEMAQMREKIVEQKVKIANLEEENIEMETKMAKMEFQIKKLKSSIRRRGMPAELFNEMFASMPFENAFGLLAKMPNGLLARNVQKMINGIKETMKNNKWNDDDYGPKLTIFDDGLEVKHTGPYGVNSIRAVMAIPLFHFKSFIKATIAFYYEMEILNEFGVNSIGFCDQQFALENEWLGERGNSHSIGFVRKGSIYIEGSSTSTIANDNGFFKKGDFVGLGIIHLPNERMECFATCNGKLMGKAGLPAKFVDLQLFPALNLCLPDDSIRTHFKKEEWSFKQFKSVLILNKRIREMVANESLYDSIIFK